MPKKGLALIAIIIIILFVAIATLGVTGFIANRFTGFDVSERLLRCTYNAQAGIHYAIYQYRASATSFSGTINVGGDAANTAAVTTTAGGGGGGAASSLVINATASTTGGTGNRDLLGITLQNTSGSAIVIDRMVIDRTSSSRNLTQIVINGVSVFSGTVSSFPANINITNTTIPAGTTRPLTRIRWSGNIVSANITLSCIMNDASTTNTCIVRPTPGSVCSTGGGSLTIQSTGRTSGSSLYKTIEATYNSSTGVISDYKEIATAVP